MTLDPSTDTTNLHAAPLLEPFLLNPRNRDYLQGKRPYVAAYYRPFSTGELSCGLIFGLCFLFVAGAVVLSGFITPAQNVPGAMLVALALVAPIIVGMVVGVRRRKLAARESHEGQIIPGELNQIAGKMTNIAGRVDAEGADYCIFTSYSFVAPSGENVTGQGSEVRNDLKHRRFLTRTFDPLPEPGTPVAVLYLDDKHFTML